MNLEDEDIQKLYEDVQTWLRTGEKETEKRVLREIEAIEGHDNLFQLKYWIQGMAKPFLCDALIQWTPSSTTPVRSLSKETLWFKE